MCTIVNGYNIISENLNDPEQSFDTRFNTQIEFLKYPCLHRYGIISLSWYQVIDSSNKYLELTDDLISNYLIRKKFGLYNFKTNHVISQQNFNVITERIGDFICEFFESSGKKLKMIENYGIIYSRTTNLSTIKHNLNCDIVINICVNNLLENHEGILCFYGSEPSILSRHKKNIRVTFQMTSGDILVYRGSHEQQVFDVISTNPKKYRTHIIIKCNFISNEDF